MNSAFAMGEEHLKLCQALAGDDAARGQHLQAAVGLDRRHDRGGIGLLTGLRFIYYHLSGNGDGYIQSLILAPLCIFLGTMMWMMGAISELISSNRKLLETINWRIQRLRDKETS